MRKLVINGWEKKNKGITNNMKEEFNEKIGERNEIAFFRLMSDLFNEGDYKSIFVTETHASSGYVKFYSTYFRDIKKVEISDILLITYDEANKDVRFSFIQAKYINKKYSNPFSFNADLVQWELLKNRPHIMNDNKKFNFPCDILNFNPRYLSITSYGVFYIDNNYKIDFLYTIPEYTYPIRINEPNGKISKDITLHYIQPQECSPETNNMLKYDRETLITCTMDNFKAEVLACKIGALLPEYMIRFFFIPMLLDLIYYKLTNSLDRKIISDIYKEIRLKYKTNDEDENNMKFFFFFNYYGLPDDFNIMIVKTNTEKKQ